MKILKYVLLTAVILGVAVSAISCNSGSSDAPLGFKEISDDGVTYDLFIPDEWTADISTGITSAYFSAQDPSNISLMAFELDKLFESLPEYWATYEPTLKAILPDMEYVGEPDETTLDGSSAIQYVYTGTMSNVSYKFMQLITIKNSTVYIFTYTAEASKYDSHIEDVIAILNYFRFH